MPRKYWVIIVVVLVIVLVVYLGVSYLLRPWLVEMSSPTPALGVDYCIYGGKPAVCNEFDVLPEINDPQEIFVQIEQIIKENNAEIRKVRKQAGSERILQYTVKTRNEDDLDKLMRIFGEMGIRVELNNISFAL